MNKLQGFYALKESDLPTVRWFPYEKGMKLDKGILWTVRSAVTKGSDLHLPRKVGVTADEAANFAEELIEKLDREDLVLCYPYFIARKSGVLDIRGNRIVIEAVKDDLWNLVTYNKRNVTVLFEEGDIRFDGDEKFLTQEELLELIDYCVNIKKKWSNLLLNGKSLLLEWSFGMDSDLEHNGIGEPYLLFYELRTV
ncbi:hypothetical protein acsn021_29300 [Anaerocolumna cellulosilytica]|uniref:Uncharacterized protein n=1 Tax=Anaerocolumna cellulosilytica TaxID=433286 RepID=A0A6S6R8S6_9FIRM|nr:hypothetical protein [Anaerocolumna cellulosilytica]MBB5197148.1 hypothetical protein [Anaerocolumna cellulosilytica]BCJ95361.1 hypothetical protein acsn021_29300 [Anaerocolumna cellulosilytica]